MMTDHNLDEDILIISVKILDYKTGVKLLRLEFLSRKEVYKRRSDFFFDE